MPATVTRTAIDDSAIQPNWAPLLRTLACLVCTCSIPMTAVTKRHLRQLHQGKAEKEQLKQELEAALKAKPEDDPEADTLLGQVLEASDYIDAYADAISQYSQPPPTALTTPPPQELSPEEVKLLTSSVFIRQLARFSRPIEPGKKNRANVYGPGEILEHLCWMNKSVSMHVADTLLDLLRESRFDQMGAPLHCIEVLVLIEDHLQRDRLAYALDNDRGEGVLNYAKRYRIRHPIFTENIIRWFEVLLARSADGLVMKDFLAGLEVEWMSEFIARKEERERLAAQARARELRVHVGDGFQV